MPHKEVRNGRIRGHRFWAGVASGALVALVALHPPCGATASRSDAADKLAAGFAEPPAEARPRVWWHWMNGNISRDGVRRDLEWMKQAGIGGVQLFEGNLGTPALVPERQVWLSAPWRDSLRYAVETARQLDLEFTVASSPGWSITGAPFVAPGDAMKKLVWREAVHDGTGHGPIRISAPASVAGPYQDIGSGNGEPGYYRDIALLAFPDAAGDDPLPVKVLTAPAEVVNAGLLTDGAYGAATPLAFGDDGLASVTYDYGRAVTIRSMSLGLLLPTGFGAPPPPAVTLETSDDGMAFRPVTNLVNSKAQVRTVTFAPVKGRFFRVNLQTAVGASGMPPVAEGVALPSQPPPRREYRLVELSFHTQGRIHRAQEKAGFATLPDYYAADTPPEAATAGIDPASVVDLTDRLRGDGTVDWTPPPGRWRLIRFGYSLTGKNNAPAPAEATGLEVDKLDEQAVARYINTYLDRVTDAAGGPGISGLLSDSIESGFQNWTPGMETAFKKASGYDLRPWMPALAGHVVGDSMRSDRFLWDFRRNIADMLSRNHYGVLRREAHKRGLTYHAEALEDHRPQLGDDLSIRSHADIPMGAMWVPPPGTPYRTTLIADVRGAASVAHVLGRKLVGAESLTSFGTPWALSPRDLKATADLEMALGVNRFMIHTSTHQPLEEAVPGLSLSPLLGQYFTRKETWAGMATAWTDYLARSSFLLQQGRPVVDIALFIGEEAPVTGLYGDGPPEDMPAGHAYDFISADMLSALSVDAGGDIVTTGGARYKVLALGGSSRRMTLATLRRLSELAAGGATIAGTRPEQSPSLGDDQTAFKALADRLWSGGRIFRSAQTALAARKIDRDWRFTDDDDAIAVMHRRIDAGHVYFISNRTGAALSGTVSLRVDGYSPEFWDAQSGTRLPAPFRRVAGRTDIPVEMAADDSLFIIMTQATAARERVITPRKSRVVTDLSDGWHLTLWAGGTRIAPVEAAPLLDWSQSANPEIRYHSGTGTYEREFQADAEWLSEGGRVLLDLGDVRELASVRVNGREAGILWRPPFRLDITRHLVAGRNSLSVTVANLWVNRLIGDAALPPDQRRTITVGPTYKPGAPLRPSGMLGPVHILVDG